MKPKDDIKIVTSNEIGQLLRLGYTRDLEQSSSDPLKMDGVVELLSNNSNNVNEKKKRY